MKKFFLKLFRYTSLTYSFFFSKKYLRFVNEIFFRLTLKASGYTNYGSLQETGEHYFIRVLGKTNPKLCIDVGANIGVYSKCLIKFTEAKIIAFEPLPAAFKLLKKLEKFHKKRFFPYNVGLSNQTASVNLFCPNNLSELATYDKNYNQVTFFKSDSIRRISSKIVTLDEFYKRNKQFFFKDGLDFIKIDTEGHEYEVLLGAKFLIKECKPNFIQIEINQYQLLKNQNLYTICKLLPDYDIFQILPFNSGLKKIISTHPNNNIFHLSNFVFIKKKFLNNNKNLI
jgi:FkbM family methyltransferase